MEKRVYDLIEWGNECYRNGKYNEAFGAYSEALKYDPSNRYIYANLGNCYMNGYGCERNSKKALGYYVDVINERDQLADTYFDYVKSLADSGDGYAAFIIGDVYSCSDYNDTDYVTGIKYYKMCIDQNAECAVNAKEQITKAFYYSDISKAHTYLDELLTVYQDDLVDKPFIEQIAALVYGAGYGVNKDSRKAIEHGKNAFYGGNKKIKEYTAIEITDVIRERIVNQNDLDYARLVARSYIYDKNPAAANNIINAVIYSNSDMDVVRNVIPEWKEEFGVQ